MFIARVVDGIVVNMEVGDQDWIDMFDGKDGTRMIPFEYPDASASGETVIMWNRPFIGYGYDEATGVFDCPPHTHDMTPPTQFPTDMVLEDGLDDILGN